MKYIISIGILLLAILFTAPLHHDINRRSYAIKLDELPMELGQWKGENMPVAEKVYKVLGTETVLSRRYTNKKEKVITCTIVYSEGERTSMHPPELCFTMGGGKIINRGKELIRIKGLSPDQDIDGGSAKPFNLRVNAFSGKLQRGKELVYYWFIVGDRALTNYYKRQFYTAWDALCRRKSKEAMVRVGTFFEEGGLHRARQRLEDFINEVFPILPEYLEEVSEN